MALDTAALARHGQRLGLRLLAKAGSLPALADTDRRQRVGRVITRATHHGLRAQTAAGRAFTPRRGEGAPVRAPHVARRGVFDLTPTPDQEMLRAAAAELADEVLRPAGSAADEACEVPATVARAAADMGLVLLGVPSDLGGIAEERSAVTSALVLTELARGDAGLAVALMAPGAVAGALAAYGSADQQATYLPAFIAEGDTPVAALALHEPAPLADPAHPETTARIEGDDLVLTGVKALVPGAMTAELFVVSATVEGAARLVIVEAAAAGVSVAPDPAMGVRAAGTGRLVLEQVRIPRTHLLGSVEDHAVAVRRARLAWAAVAVGVGQAVLDQVRGYVIERHAFGEPIAHRQAVAFTVADLAIELDGLRLVVLRAAARLDAGLDASREIALARSLATRHGARIGSDGVQLLGGHGFVKEHPNERWYRDLQACGLIEGGLLL